MRSRITTLLSILGVMLVSPAWSKPISMQPDRELKACVWAAEVQVLAIDGNEIRVRVTSDPQAVFRGYALMDRVIAVSPAAQGPSTCLAEMRQFAASKTTMLMVVRQGNRVAFVGQPGKRKGERFYRLRTWCDFNAWWMFSQDQKFGRKVPDRRSGEMNGGFEATYAETAALFRKERAEFYSKTFKSILAGPQAVQRDGIEKMIKQLRSDSFRARERAERLLGKAGLGALPLIRQAYLNAEDIEQRYRLNKIIARMETSNDHYRFIEKVKAKSGVAGIARLIIDTYDAVSDQATRRQCVQRLRQLAPQATPPLKLALDASAEEVLKVWRQRTM